MYNSAKNGEEGETIIETSVDTSTLIQGLNIRNIRSQAIKRVNNKREERGISSPQCVLVSGEEREEEPTTFEQVT